ncbi:hypothetical protein OHC33_002675 [Knufia fluminis]|uniref:Uncharacterized protein n=1 Tax=Knufia fluminis TaxID=191047 RepID=A0AAN8I5V7_9EURO|nr:hypothetical protein OHC33_002675 [Knufia fluminis]
MDRENTEAYFTAMALVDAIVAFKNLRLTRGFVSAADRQLFDGLNLAGLAKVVLPPPALMLIRYLCMRTGDALQSRLRRDPVAELTSEGGNNADLEASCLCRSILFTTQIITASGTPFRMFLNNQGFFSGLYNVQHDLTMDLVAHLEDPNLDNSECRDGMVLQLVLDQALKKEMLTDEERRLPIKEVVADDIDKWTGITGVADRLQFEHDHDTQTQSDDAQRDADQDTSIQAVADFGARLRGRTDPKEACHCLQVHGPNGREARTFFQNRSAVDTMLASINLEDIGTRLLAHATRIGNMDAHEVREAASEALKDHDLDMWPDSAYLN